jgi:hypothetical protein
MKLDSLFGGNKKGQMGIPGPVLSGIGTVFGLFIIGIFIFAFAIAGAEMQTATTDTTAIGVINQTVQGADSFASFSPTLWIITAIGVLLGILIVSVGGFFFMSRN